MLIALLGAECTGKSSLTVELGRRLGAATVGEYLREWCLAAGRTPQAPEQAGIAAEQQRRIEAALKEAPRVVADTTALMIAVYSLQYFQDASLLPAALQAQRQSRLNLVCSPAGFPWQADGWMRDGEAARQQTHGLLLKTLDGAGIPYQLLDGDPHNRALRAETLIRQHLPPA